MIAYDVETNKVDLSIVSNHGQVTSEKDEAYWQARYIELLERYSKLLKETNLKNVRKLTSLLKP